MTLLELFLLTVVDHRSGIAASGLVDGIAGLVCLGIAYDKSPPHRTLKRVCKVLCTFAVINLVLAMWVPDENRLRCFTTMECK